MIAVAGTPNIRRFNPLWNRAVAPVQWWQNPSLSFGAGAPVQVPSSSIAVDPPPIQANVAPARRRPRGGAETMCSLACEHHGVGIKFHRCYQSCLAGTLTTGIPKPGGRPSKPARRRRIAASARRRNVSVGSCCGGGCPGCECGKGDHDRASNPSTVLIGDMAFSPPTTSRLLNRAPARRRKTRRRASRAVRRACCCPALPGPPFYGCQCSSYDGSCRGCEYCDPYVLINNPSTVLIGDMAYSPTPSVQPAPQRMANSCLSECIASGEDMYNCMGKCLGSATQVHGRRATPSRARGRGARMRPTRGRRLANRAKSRLRPSRAAPGRITAVPGVRKACPDGWTEQEKLSGTYCCWRPSKYFPWFCRPKR
jgi:hypothetical protein